MTLFHAETDSELASLVQQHSQILAPDSWHDGLAAFADRIGSARIVLLGESTHGTSEFYRARDVITRRLVDRHGFRIVAIEGDWPDAAELDRYVRHNEPWGERDAFVNFPRWMWRNKEFADCLAGLRQWNANRPAEDHVAIRGLDVYSLDASIAAVLEYLDQMDPDAARRARERYACFSPYGDHPQVYGATSFRTGKTCEDDVVRQLIELLEKRIAYEAGDGERFFDAEQNARVVCAAEKYYRAMFRGSALSWNLRDMHMFSTLKRLLQQGGLRSKAIIWAHNSHIGNAAATTMKARGEINIGQLCREHFGVQVFSVGFLTGAGTVMAADEWSGPARIKEVLPPLRESWEQVFNALDVPGSLSVWRRNEHLRKSLDHVRLERAIGVIYRPDTERLSHYFGANLARQFDGVVWLKRTSAVTPLLGRAPEGEPDTYPFGL